MSLDKEGCVPLNGQMDLNPPTADDIRQTLIARAEAFAMKHKVSLSRIGLDAVRDSKFLAECKGGRNFTIDSYQKVMDWMDAAEANSERAA